MRLLIGGPRYSSLRRAPRRFSAMPCAGGSRRSTNGCSAAWGHWSAC